MIYPMVSFPVTLSDSYFRFQGHGVTKLIDAIEVLCSQLTRDLFAIAKFLFLPVFTNTSVQLSRDGYTKTTLLDW